MTRDQSTALAWTIGILGAGSFGIWWAKRHEKEVRRWLPEAERGFQRFEESAEKVARRGGELAKQAARKVESEARRFHFPSLEPYLPRIPVIPFAAIGTFVQQVQTALTNAGYPTGGVDGAWYDKTTKAAAAYQAAHALPVTGNPEPSLLSSLGVAAPALPASLVGFTQALVKGATGLLQDPLDAVRLFLNESGLSATIENHRGFPSGTFAVGIFQIINKFLPISVESFKALGVTGQLPYAFQSWRGKFASNRVPVPASGRDLYWVNFLPASYKPGSSDDYVLAKSDDTYQRPNGTWEKLSGVYSANTSLDVGSKGFITAGDLKSALARGPKGNNALVYAALANALLASSPLVAGVW